VIKPPIDRDRLIASADERVSLAEVEACASVLAAWVRSELLA
jgi:hypothetical protein